MSSWRLALCIVSDSSAAVDVAGADARGGMGSAICLWWVRLSVPIIVGEDIDEAHMQSA